jgi:hypothetical protein
LGLKPCPSKPTFGVNPSTIKKKPKAQKTINLPSLMQIAREVDGFDTSAD